MTQQQDSNIVTSERRPYRIRLISMPFADVIRPPLGLMQLRSVVESEFGAEVDVQVVFGNNLFAKRIGLSLFQEICGNLANLYSGLGDWMFRSLAFPDQVDNDKKYLTRFYPDEGNRAFRENIIRIRSQLPIILTEMIERFALDDADICGFTSMFQQTCAALALARMLKQRNPMQLNVIGGPNCDAPMGEVLLGIAPQIDAAFSGPALKSFPTFVRNALEGSDPLVHSIPGVYTRQRTPVSLDGKKIGEERDINDEVIVDYRDFVEQLQRDVDPELKPIVAFETSRGCWWGERSHCAFCGLNAESLKYRSLASDKAVEMFRRMFEQVPNAAVYTAVDNILPKAYPTEVLPFINPPEGATIFYEVRADMSDDDFEQLKKASVAWVQPGIESLATRTLKLMRKGTTAFTNVRFLKSCIRHSVAPDWNLLIGFPGEESSTYEKYERDIPLLAHLPAPQGVFMIRFDRFSPYYIQQKKYGLKLEPMEFYSYIYPLSSKTIADVAYYFIDKSYAPYKVEALTWLGKLNVAVSTWIDTRTKRRPILMFDADGESVLDSRFSSTVERMHVGTSCRRMLELMSDRPVGRQELFSNARNAGIDDPEPKLCQLSEQRLLLEENGRFMSLVMPTAAEAV